MLSVKDICLTRRSFLRSSPALTAACMPAAAQITHVDVLHSGQPLKSIVVKGTSLPVEGDSPGARARVHFNGPTAQLAAAAAGFVTLEPGSRPHPPHRHPEEEFLMVTDGRGEIEIAGAITQVEAGDIMYAEANVLHGIRNSGTSMMTFYFIKMQGKNV